MIAKLARAYPNARIIYSGGDASLLANKAARPTISIRCSTSFGVPRARVQVENRSRNTNENAIFSKAMAEPKPGERWLLVTSAHSHAACDWLFPPRRFSGRGLSGRLDDTRPIQALRRIFSSSPVSSAPMHAVHEWTGLVA